MGIFSISHPKKERALAYILAAIINERMNDMGRQRAREKGHKKVL
jgi:hypothetical protein